MANFIGCRAEGNGLGGFVTTNPNSTFENCTAVGNQGPGFLDLSAVTQVRGYISELERAISNDSSLNKNREELDKEIAQIKAELQTAKPKSSEIKGGLERILSIVKVVGAANTTISLVEKIPSLIEFIHTHIHLFSA